MRHSLPSAFFCAMASRCAARMRSGRQKVRKRDVGSAADASSQGGERRVPGAGQPHAQSVLRALFGPPAAAAALAPPDELRRRFWPTVAAGDASNRSRPRFATAWADDDPAGTRDKERADGISCTHALPQVHGRLLVKESGPGSHYSVCAVQRCVFAHPSASVPRSAGGYLLPGPPTPPLLSILWQGPSFVFRRPSHLASTP